MRRISGVLTVLLGSCLVLLAGLRAEARAAAVEVPVTFTWVVDGRLAWLYLGVQRGTFAQEGLNVRVHRGYGEYNAGLAVDQGRFLFAVNVDTSTIVQMRTTKNDVRGIMVLESRPSLGYSAFAEKGIRTPKDFEGRSIGLQPGSASEKVFPMLAKLNGVDPAKIKMVSLSGDVYVPTFLAGRVDLISAYSDGFYPSLVLRLKKQSRQLNAVWIKDWGMDAYGSMVVTKERTLREQPDVVRRFLGAAKRSWDAAKADPAGAVQAMRAAVPEVDPEVTLAQWNALVEIAEDGQSPWGCAAPAKLQRSIEIYREAFGITETVPPRDVLTTEFIPWCRGQ